MDKLKQWVALTAVACLALSAAGWFLLISPKRAEAADLRMQSQERLQANADLENQLQVLKAQAKDLPKEQAKLAAVAAKIPDNPALPGLIRSLIEAADASGVELVSITPSTPTLVAPAAPVAPVATEEGAAQTAPDPAAPAPAAAGPATGPAGQLAEVPLTISVVGDYFQVQQFLNAVEELSRAVKVTTVDLTPGASPTAGNGGDSSAVEQGRSLTASISGSIYMAANRPAPLTATVPGADGVPADAVAADAAPADDTADAAE
jgi:Tfp pilus assembly protein PilO